MAGRGFTVAANLGILVIMICFLGAVSGLKIAHKGCTMALLPSDSGQASAARLLPRRVTVVAKLKATAERHLGRAVFTIPQHFGQAATWEAVLTGELAGLEVDVDGNTVMGLTSFWYLRWFKRASNATTSSAVYAGKLARLEIMDDTISEPVAAAFAHGLHRKLRKDRGALVLRIGGGTTDASVVTLWDGSLEVIGYEDDPFLGGDDFDQRIVDYFVELIKTKHGKDITQDRVALARLRTACERAKKALSSEDRVQVSIESLFDSVDFLETLLRSEFEELNDELFGKVIALVNKAMVQ
ncbi:hypothetical protein QOZ80_4BG0358450 [Eleusine coracana subsp. coracana]|nr:hypothetical protein QOZ80_4BG0358450 [Eleusine coracana subsp. coracana]